MQPQRGKIRSHSCLKKLCSKARLSLSSFNLLFLSTLLYKDSTKPMQSPVKFIFLWSGNIGPSPEVVRLSQSPDTSCLSDELLYPRGSYLANRQMAKKVKLVGVLFVTREAHSQLKSPEANRFGSHSPSFWVCSQNPTGAQLTGKGQSRGDFASLGPQPGEEATPSQPQG